MQQPNPSNIWQGRKVRLRALEPGDADFFYRMNEDTEIARMLWYVWPHQSLAAVRRWVEKSSTEEVKDDRMDFVILDESGKPVGQIGSHTTDRRVGSFRYGISLLRERRGRGYAAEAVYLLLRYFFDELRYQKCTATVYSNNPASLRFHEKMGFTLEGRLRRVVFTGGEFHDELYYGMTVEEFRAKEWK